MKTIEEILNSGVELAPYNFELYHAFNPNLTKEVYEFLRGNGTEWKIICGFEVKIQFSNHYLEGDSGLMMSNLKVFKNRFISEYHLNPTNWNHGNNRR